MPKPGIVVKTSSSSAYTPEILHGDCTGYMFKWWEDGRTFDFIFADPPFNIGQKYRDYLDVKNDKEYRDFTRLWLAGCCDLLAYDGVLCLHGPDDLAVAYLEYMESRMERIAWINWHYRFGQCGRSNWIDSRCHCLIYRPFMATKTVWNPEEVLDALMLTLR
jgi:site-specific DNA-methyltransferase (adenine-specific)